MSLQVILAAFFYLLLLLPVILYYYFKYWQSEFHYWQKRGVPFIPGKFPYGSNKEFTNYGKFRGYIHSEMCKKFPNQKYFGIYFGVTPILIVHDPETIRLILTKEFAHFRDRALRKFDESDILAKHLFLLDGEKWRALRVKMSPTFSTGKLKGMFSHFVKSSEVMENLLLKEVDKDIGVKDLTSRFSVDVICSCAFGLEANSINDEKSPFRMFMKDGMSQGPPRRTWKYIFEEFKKKYLPFIKSQATIRITPIPLEQFMMKVVRDSVEHREKTGEKRNDFIDLLIQLEKKGNLAEAENNQADLNIEPILMTPEIMAAQCFVFFAAGHETSSSVKTFALYELALHQEMQERLRREILSVIEKHGEISYQAVQEMEYLDMVVNETMRKYPTLMQLDRNCSSDFTFPDGTKIEKGTAVVIPTWAIQHDPEIFPEPEQFNPERFTREAREARHPFVFLPFGEGPRICIGQRFGLLQTKMGLITFLRKFRVDKCEKTEVPLQLKAAQEMKTKTGCQESFLEKDCNLVPITRLIFRGIEVWIKTLQGNKDGFNLNINCEEDYNPFSVRGHKLAENMFELISIQKKQKITIYIFIIYILVKEQ